MTFTFNPALASDLDRVRFAIGDTDGDGHYLDDETVAGLLAAEGSVEAAVVAALRHLVARLNQPNVKADWLQVETTAARDGFQRMLDARLDALGQGGATLGVIRAGLGLDALSRHEWSPG